MILNSQITFSITKNILDLNLKFHVFIGVILISIDLKRKDTIVYYSTCSIDGNLEPPPPTPNLSNLSILGHSSSLKCMEFLTSFSFFADYCPPWRQIKNLTLSLKFLQHLLLPSHLKASSQGGGPYNYKKAH